MGVPFASLHAYSLKSRYGKVRPLRKATGGNDHNEIKTLDRFLLCAILEILQLAIVQVFLYTDP